MGEMIFLFYSQLKKKNVVNVVTGVSLGLVNDLVIDDETGTISAICVPGAEPGFLSRMRGASEMAIPWHCLERIGGDVILARVETYTKAGDRIR